MRQTRDKHSQGPISLDAHGQVASFSESDPDSRSSRCDHMRKFYAIFFLSRGAFVAMYGIGRANVGNGTLIFGRAKRVLDFTLPCS